jgi:hypothetical protein
LEETAYAALRMGLNIARLRKDLDGLLIKSRSVIEALDLAMKVLFPYPTFMKVAFDLFLKFTDGKLNF